MALKSKKLDQVREDVPVQHVIQEQLVRINLQVPESTRQAWKQRALDANKTMTELIIEAMSK